MENNTVLKVKRRPKVSQRGFYKAFETLPHKSMSPVRIELMNSLGWSISCFYYKMRGDTSIRENEAPVIESIFQGFGIDAWTGEKI